MNEFVSGIINELLTPARTGGETPPRPNYQRDKSKRRPEWENGNKPTGPRDKLAENYAFLRSAALARNIPPPEDAPGLRTKIAAAGNLPWRALMIEQPSEHLARDLKLRLGNADAIGLIKAETAGLAALFAVDEAISVFGLANSIFNCDIERTQNLCFYFADDSVNVRKVVERFARRENFNFYRDGFLVKEKVSNFLSRYMKASARLPLAAREAVDELSLWPELNRYYTENRDCFINFKFVAGALVAQGDEGEILKALARVTGRRDLV
nr:hypothetical protein [Acidaminococcales bacterium]